MATRSTTARWITRQESRPCSTSPRCSRSLDQTAAIGPVRGGHGARRRACWDRVTSPTHPTVDRASIVADINTDMFMPLYPLKRLTIFGLDESDVGDDAAAVARSLGITPRPDPEPRRNVFIRSDQYSFIRQGIPSVMIAIGYAKGSPEEKIVHEWLAKRYHAPSDDVNQPIDKKAAGEFDVVVARLLERVANRDERTALEGILVLQTIRPLIGRHLARFLAASLFRVNEGRLSESAVQGLSPLRAIWALRAALTASSKPVWFLVDCFLRSSAMNASRFFESSRIWRRIFLRSSILSATTFLRSSAENFWSSSGSSSDFRASSLTFPFSTPWIRSLSS